MKKIILLASLFLTVNEIFGQSNQIIYATVDSIFISRADFLINKFDDASNPSKKQIIAQLDHGFILVFKFPESYKVIKGLLHYNYRKKIWQLDSIKINFFRHNKQLQRCFNMPLCNPISSLIGTDSLASETGSDRFVYLCLRTRQHKLCESVFPALNVSTTKFPVKFSKSYGYLIRQLIYPNDE